MGDAQGNGTRAAELAGYSARNARPQASRLLTKANVQAAIAARRERSESVSMASREEKLRILAAIMRDPDAWVVARLKAVDLHNKMQGEYIERHVHAHGSLEDVLAGVPFQSSAPSPAHVM